MNHAIHNQSTMLRDKLGIDTPRTDQLNPRTSIIFLIVDLILLVLNFYFHYLIRRMISRKDTKKVTLITQTLLKCYSVIVPSSFLIVFIYLNIILRYTYPPSEAIGEWFCFVYEYFAHTTGLYLGSFTLFTAGMKYWFIVDNAKAKSFGEEKAKSIFSMLHLGVPFTMAAFNSLSNGKRDQIYVVNICWGDNSSGIPDPADDIICSNRQYEIANYLGESAEPYVEPILRITCGSITVLYIMICSNVGELILYGLMFKYLNR